jgi:anti-sigma28 factor (negative regulator of flagellin synthesis)
MDNKAGKRPMRMTTSKKLMMVPMRRNPVMKKAAQKNTAKKVNKPEEGLTVSQSQQLDNTFERASTLDEKRLAAVQMIQSGLLPNTLATIDQLDDPETRKGNWWSNAIIEYGRDENHTLDRLEWNARRAKL